LKTIFVSKFQLDYRAGDPVRQISFQIPRVSNPRFLFDLSRLLLAARSADAVFVSNPRIPELIFMYAARRLFGNRLQLFVFDLIMHAPQSFAERLVNLPKRLLLTAVDWFLFIHRDTRGYEKHFGIRRERCVYVPFKANNFDLADKIAPVDGDYLLALGASQRDYQLLVDAVTGLDVQLKILLPRESIYKHNAVLGTELPINVAHIDVMVDRAAWSRYIAESRIVVVPLLPGVVQPAGISVYLEAMIFGKPVIISRGASTEGILDSELAVLVTPGSVGEMRDAIWKLWNDPEHRQRLSVSSKAYALSLKDHSRLLQDVRSILDERLAES
jgi:glycosyltransferase involved in cell wall biosynthesis